MPLKGEAKKLYQREYMRHYMRIQRNGFDEGWNPDGYCGACGRYGIVDNHHKDRNSSNNNKSNRIFLCPNCHALIHRRGKTLEQIISKTMALKGEAKKAYQHIYMRSYMRKKRAKEKLIKMGRLVEASRYDADGYVIPKY